MHKRIWPFNTKDTLTEQKLDNDLCQTVVAKGTMVFVRADLGQDLSSSESVAIGDAPGETTKAIAKTEGLLKKAGSQLEQVCEISIYIVDPRYREGIYRVVGKWLRLRAYFRCPPGSSCRRWLAPSGWSRSTP